ncbi:MAG: hypothetical protein ABIQ36_03485, partial [Rhodanobacter sp.]
LELFAVHGSVWGINGTTITLDEQVTLEPGKDYEFSIRKATAVQEVKAITSAAGTGNAVTIATAVTGMAIGDLYEVGDF